MNPQNPGVELSRTRGLAMNSSRRTLTIATAVLVVSSVTAGLTLQRVDRLRTGANVQEVLYIQSPAVLRRMSLGYTGLLADIYWTRAVQYFGHKHHEYSMEYKL